MSVCKHCGYETGHEGSHVWPCGCIPAWKAEIARLAAENARLAGERDAAVARAERYEEALRIYADADHWIPTQSGFRDWWDCGNDADGYDLAQRALAGADAGGGEGEKGQ